MDRPLRYDKANWDMIRAEILLLDNKQDDPTAVQQSLSEIVLRHTPRARCGAKLFWCNSLNAKKRAIQKLPRKRPKDPNLPILRRDYRKAIAQAKLEANGRALQEETDPECFRTVKVRQTRHPIPALQKTGGGRAAEHPHIAQELPDSLYGDEHDRANTRITAKAEPLNTGILNAAIRQLPNGAAPGPDHITTRLIKELCKLREDRFLRRMNGAWIQGIPDTWKASNTILIPKAKKATYTAAKSWGPIQLQSILAKVLERAAVQRMADLGILETNMYGGRKQNGTTDAIQAINDTITNNPGSYTCLSTLDVKEGLDHLQLDKVCQTIARKSQHLVQWVEHWGTNSARAYCFNGKNSRAFATDKGTPQGSPLSPILFLVSIRDIAAMATTNFPAATNPILT